LAGGRIHDGSMSTGPGRRTRQIAAQLARVACPRSPGGPHLVDRVVEDFARLVPHLSPLTRRSIGPALWLFDELARLREGNRGRRFVALDDARADRYVARILNEQTGALSMMHRLTKGLVTFCWYEQPEVRAALGYDPDGYIAMVSARRLKRYRDEVTTAWTSPPATS
jgi:hypothetical protein